jgi:predicted MFS family arabinose efflux permease
MTHGPQYKWVLLGLLFLAGALNYADRSAVSSVFPLIRTDLSMSDVQLAAVGSFFLWAYALASPLAGIAADRFSRSAVILLSLAGWSAVTLVTGFVTTAWELLATRALLGLFEAAYIPAAIGLLADYHSSRTRATALGIHAAGLPAGIVAGGAGFGYLGDHFGWRSGFVVLGVMGLVFALVARSLLRDADIDAEKRRSVRIDFSGIANIAELLRIRSILLILASGMCIGVGNWIFINWLPLYFKETFDMSLAGAGFAGTFTLQGAGVLGGITGSVFSDRVAGTKPRRRMAIQAVACAIATPFVLVFLWPHPGLAVVNASIFLFSFSLTFGACNMSPLTCDLLPPRLRSTAMGVGNALNSLAGGIGVMLSGFLKSSIGLAGVFVGISAMTLLCAACMFVGYRWFLRRDLEAVHA